MGRGGQGVGAEPGQGLVGDIPRPDAFASQLTTREFCDLGIGLVFLHILSWRKELGLLNGFLPACPV